MITLSPSSDPTSGALFCVSVAGNVGKISVLAELDGDVLPTEVIKKNGHFEICVKIPAGSKGKAVSLSVADSKENENGIVRFVGK